jgi:hypothetical protein
VLKEATSMRIEMAKFSKALSQTRKSVFGIAVAVVVVV